MTFRDLKLPNGLAKKKKLTLYKCWMLEPLDKGSPIRELRLNPDRDRYALTAQQAVEAALNEQGFDKVVQLFGQTMADLTDNLTDSNAPNLRSYFYVILSVTLENGVTDENVVIPPNGEYTMDLDPHFNPKLGLLTVTIRDRYSDMEIKNYTIKDIGLNLDRATEHIGVTLLTLEEVVINHAVAGGK